jgi:hypothetical protein
MGLTWSIPQPPRPDLLARLGRRWAVTHDGNEVSTRPKYSRFWSRDLAQAEAAQRNRAEEIWVGLGLHQAAGQDRYAVTDLMAGRTDMTTRALGIAERVSGWTAAICALAMVVLAIVAFVVAVTG